MFRRIAAGAILCALLTATVFAQDAPAKQPKAKPDTQRLLITVRSAAAVDLVEVLKQSYANDASVSLVAEPRTNSILVAGPEKALREIEGLLKRLDMPAKSVAIKVTYLRFEDKDGSAVKRFDKPIATDDLAKEIVSLRKENSATVSTLDITAIENERGMAQIGDQVPVTTGVYRRPGGAAQRQTQYMNAGVIVSATPIVEERGDVLVSLNFNMSKIETPEPKDDEEFAPSTTRTLTAESTYRIATGQAVPLGKWRVELDGKTYSEVVVVSATVQEKK